MSDISGKVCLVTGSSRGIGLAIAELFAEKGAKVVCAARTVHEGDHKFAGSLDSTIERIRTAGGTAHAVAADISEYDECARLVQETRDVYGPVDVLVNNAALTYYIPITEYPLNRWHRSMAVNVHAPFYLSQLVLPDMIARGSGAIVNLTSGSAVGPGRGPYPEPPAVLGGTLYGAEKAALERFTQGLAHEVYQYGVSVSAVAPSGVVPTGGTVHHGLAKDQDPRFESPQTMAQAVLLLATEPLDKVTGRVCYSQKLLMEYGLFEGGKGFGFERGSSGYSLR